MRRMSANGRSIYGCTAAPKEFVAPKGTVLTYNPKTNCLYLHILEWPIKVLPITFSDKVAYARDVPEVRMGSPGRRIALWA